MITLFDVVPLIRALGQNQWLYHHTFFKRLILFVTIHFAPPSICALGTSYIQNFYGSSSLKSCWQLLCCTVVSLGMSNNSTSLFTSSVAIGL